MLYVHKTRIHLNNKQSAWMRSTCVAGRLAYNFAIFYMKEYPYYPDPLRVREAWSGNDRRYSERDIRHPWMRGYIPLNPISDVIAVNFGAALKNWKRSGYSGDTVPKFKRKSAPLSITMSYITISDKHINDRWVTLPMKMGAARLAEPLRFEGKLKKTTFSYRAGKWYAAFLIESEKNQYNYEPTEENPIGVDVGVVHHATLSNGNHINYAQKDLTLKITKAQRKLSRKKKGSANWRKQCAKLAKLKSKEACIRNNTIEHISKELAENYNPIVMEDRLAAKLTRSAKGTAEQPGKNVSAKSGLNRAILDKAWGALRVKTEYKSIRRGGMVIAVNPAYTSQTCPACGHISKENRKTQSEFKCTACNYTANADIVGAQNILNRGLSRPG